MRTTFLCVTWRASSSSRLNRRSISAARVGIGHHLRANHLDRDRDAELRIPGLIDGAHAADAEQPDDVIARTERLADGERSVFWARWCEFRSAGGGLGVRTKSRLVFVGFWRAGRGG